MARIERTRIADIDCLLVPLCGGKQRICCLREGTQPGNRFILIRRVTLNFLLIFSRRTFRLIFRAFLQSRIIAITGGDDVENSSGQKECVRFTDLSSGRALSSFTTAAVTCLAVRRGDAYAVSGHKDGKAYLWDVDSQSAAHVLDGHHSAVRSISIDRS